jgi:Bacterial protein of unknown function (DUF922)
MPLLLYFILIGIFRPAPVKQNNDLIDWNAERKLSWNDFRAEPDKSFVAAALTSTSIKIDFSYYNETLQYHIHCRFDKNKSWVRVKNDYILAHEQAHFDIAEIYARKLNKVLKAYKPNEAHLSNDVNKIYDNMMKEYYAKQEEYDNETNYSINRSKQEEWLKKVKEELLALQDYAKYN